MEKDLWDNLHDAKNQNINIGREDFVFNYGRLCKIRTTQGFRDISGTVELVVYQDNEVEYFWSGNTKAVLHFASGKKRWIYRFFNGDVHRATINFFSTGEADYVELTLKQKEKHFIGYSEYRPYYSTKKTVVKKSEWDKAVEIARAVYALDAHLAKERAEKSVDKS